MTRFVKESRDLRDLLSRKSACCTFEQGQRQVSKLYDGMLYREIELRSPAGHASGGGHVSQMDLKFQH